MWTLRKYWDGIENNWDTETGMAVYRIEWPYTKFDTPHRIGQKSAIPVLKKLITIGKFWVLPQNCFQIWYTAISKRTLIFWINFFLKSNFLNFLKIDSFLEINPRPLAPINTKSSSDTVFASAPQGYYFPYATSLWCSIWSNRTSQSPTKSIFSNAFLSLRTYQDPHPPSLRSCCDVQSDHNFEHQTVQQQCNPAPALLEAGICTWPRWCPIWSDWTSQQKITARISNITALAPTILGLDSSVLWHNIKKESLNTLLILKLLRQTFWIL